MTKAAEEIFKVNCDVMTQLHELKRARWRSPFCLAELKPVLRDDTVGRHTNIKKIVSNGGHYYH